MCQTEAIPSGYPQIPFLLSLSFSSLSSIPSETQQLQVLREATVDKIDKQIIDKLMSVAEVMSHFYSRYGTQEAVAKRFLDGLELLPHPNDACLE